MQKLIDPELESLGIIHLIDAEDSNYGDWGTPPKLKLTLKYKVFERDELIMTDKDVEIVSDHIKSQKLVDNEISNWDLVSMEIDIKSNGLGISRSDAWESIKDDAYEPYYYGATYVRYQQYI